MSVVLFVGATVGGSPLPDPPPPPETPVPRRAHVYLREPWWPFPRIAELVTAHDINRSFAILEPGQADVRISRLDPQISTDTLRRGNLLEITGPHTPTWVGPITALDESRQAGQVAISAIEMSAILQRRSAAEGDVFDEGAGGNIFEALVRRANRRAHTGMVVSSLIESSTPIRDFDASGQQVLDAINDLADATNNEWWIEVTIATPSRLEVVLHWGERQGYDQAAETVLQEPNLIDLRRRQDVSQVREVVNIIGGGGSIASRPAVSRSASRAGVDAADLGGPVESLNEALVRQFIDTAPILRGELTILVPGTSDRTELSRLAAQAAERPLATAEIFTARVNDQLNWSEIHLGDYLRVKTDRLALGPINRKLRVRAMQPDEEMGELELVLETPTR